MIDYERFMNRCKSFNKEMSFEDYCRCVSKCLVFLGYNYYPDQALNLIKTSKNYIKKHYYDKRETVYTCAVEIGYSCG